MKDRIKEYIEYKQISAGELATLLEVQRSNISHILNGRNKPGASFIEKLLLVFQDLNARWLLTGEGSMVDGLVSEAPVASTVLPFGDVVGEDKKIVQPEKETKKEELPKTVSSLDQDSVDKMILLFNDGTFTTYKNRDNK